MNTKTSLNQLLLGFDHDIKGQALFAYVICENAETIDQSEMKMKINDHLTKKIGAIAKLEHLLIVSGLPKTRSGKIMRRILRKLAQNQSSELGDVSTLLDPSIIEEISQKRAKLE